MGSVMVGPESARSLLTGEQLQLNAEQRIEDVNGDSAGGGISYLYDPEGQRVAKQASGAGLDLSTITGFKFAYGDRGGLPGGAGGKPSPVSLSITGKGSKLSVSGNVRIGPTPFSIGLGSSTGGTITSVNVAVRYGLASIQAYTNISNFGDPRCK